MKNETVNIHDVARLSGVSIGTVSRVFNNRDGVKESTREKVFAIASQQGYSKRKGSLNFPNIRHIRINSGSKATRFAPFTITLQEELIHLTEKDNVSILHEEIDSDGLPLKRDFSKPYGVILLNVQDDDHRVHFYKSHNIPIVALGHSQICSEIFTDDYVGGGMAASHLIKLGHKSILFIGNTAVRGSDSSRYHGFKDFIEKNPDITHSSIHIAPLPPQENIPLTAYRLMIKEQKSLKDFTAIFCDEDLIAYGVSLFLADNGISVPSHISIIGFDDLPFISDNLTTIRQDFKQLAKGCLTLLVESFQKMPPKRIVVKPSLVTRGSTRGIQF